MAEQIADIEERMGRRPMYPWEDWSDGRAWRITRGKDFEVAAHVMSSIIRQHASRRGLTARTRVPDDHTVEFQFVERAVA